MKIYERIMQVRSGRWEIGVIEDHQARPLTEEEMTEAIGRLNAKPDETPAQSSADGGLRAVLQEVERFLGPYADGGNSYGDMYEKVKNALAAEKAAPDSGLREVLELLLYDIRPLTPGENAERMIPTQHRVSTIRQAQEARNRSLQSSAPQGVKETT